MRHLLGLFMGITKEDGDGKYFGLSECFNGFKRELLAFISDKLKRNSAVGTKKHYLWEGKRFF